MRVLVKEFKRTARHNWCCEKCHQMILAGTKYQDQEIYYIGYENTVIKHKRLCAVCVGYIKEPKTYVFKEPEPVVDLTDNIKYWLIGKGYNKENKLCLLVQDWLDTKYHWKEVLWTLEGDKIKVGNVEFTNA